MKVYNKEYQRDFETIETYEAGIALHGGEVKAVREGRIQLAGSFVKIMEGDEAYLINAEIPLYEFARRAEDDARRSRRLLLHKQEIVRLKTKLSSSPNLTIIPISCYTKGSRIKLEIALCRGRKAWQVKKVEKRRDEERQAEKEMKEYIKR